MKKLVILCMSFFASDLLAKETLSVFGITTDTSSEKVIKVLKINQDSKVLVGNKNNPFPVDFLKKKQKIFDELTSKFPNAGKVELQELIEQVSQLEVGNVNYEISCSEKICDTSFLEDNKIIYFITRFSNANKMGNLSMRLKRSGLHRPSDVVKELLKEHGETTVMGDFKRSKKRTLNYTSADGSTLNINILTAETHTTIEYRLYNYDVFIKEVEQRKRIISEFEAAL